MTSTSQKQWLLINNCFSSAFCAAAFKAFKLKSFWFLSSILYKLRDCDSMHIKAVKNGDYWKRVLVFIEARFSRNLDPKEDRWYLLKCQVRNWTLRPEPISKIGICLQILNRFLAYPRNRFRSLEPESSPRAETGSQIRNWFLALPILKTATGS